MVHTIIMTDMQGTLWKWTNYFSGWQPRWFVLENGILAYYKSQEDVLNGCKGSIKMAVCDVSVHGTDMSRLDLIIPGEAHFYVKAATSQERQQWLVALGSAKACLTNGKSQQNTVAEIPEEQLKAKKSELRLYCDLLMQQVHSVKSTVQESEPPTAEKLNEATTLLSATCDTFINTLEDCMRLSSAQTFDSPHSPTIPSSPARKSPSAKTVPWNGGGIQRSISVDRLIPSTLKGHRVSRTRTVSRSSLDSTELPTEPPPVARDNAITTKEAVWLSHLHEIRRSLIDLDTASLVPTYFTKIPTGFHDVVLTEDKGIPTVVFLEACRAILPVVDKLNPTAFAPVKLDLDGNIKKIHQKYSADPDEFTTLQKIVQYEIKHNQHGNPMCATAALLWLKRGLEYIHELGLQYVSGVDDLAEAATSAYVKTLKRYHSWVVRGVFGLAVKKVPTKREFLQHLSLDPSDVNLPLYEKSLLRDIDAYVVSMETILKVLNQYYTQHDLDSDEQV